MIELDARLRPPTHRSRRFRQLRIRLHQIQAGLELENVPANQNDVDRIHSYRLLAHAEIQSYLEDLAEGILSVSEESLLQRGKVTHAAHHLTVFESVLKLAQKYSAQQATYPLFSRQSAVTINASSLESALGSHRKRIKKNNGVKQADLKILMGPLGYRDSWYVPGFLDQMSAFGERRGDVAHNSGLIGAAVLPTGLGEVAMVGALMPGLNDLDRYSARLLMPI